MKKFFTVFFVTLGVIFFTLLLIGGYFFMTDPLDLKPVIIGTDTVEQTDGVDEAATTSDKHPLLSPTQEKALETFGIDPAAVPSSITPEQDACFIEILGSARVGEIKAGDSPTATEFFKAKGCL